MMQSSDNLHLAFLRRLAGEPLSVDRLRKGFELVALFFDLCGIEAELLGSFQIEGEEKDITLYEKEGGVPAGEPLKFAFRLNNKRNAVFYIYPETGSLSDDEKEDLEAFATEALLYLEILHLKQETEKKGAGESTEILPNASGYIRDVTELMKRDIPLKKYTAFYFNLKDFGEINKRYGRVKGDEVLRDYAEIIKDFLTKDEAAGHLGGDNFMALIHKKRQKDFINLLSDITIFLESDKEEEIHLSSTIGVWDIQSDVAYPGEVVSRPSIALNQAKNVIHQPIAYADDRLIEQMHEQRSVLKFFSEALEKEEFVVYYQPKVDSRNRTLVGAEGLVRWFHNGKMISPGVFIPALEGTGECLALDYYVLKRACRDIQSWISQGIEPVTVSVNFSRKDLKDRKLADNINKIVEESGIDKSLIEVELTETVDTEEQGVLSGFISKLYRKGIMTAVDDFGSGYSSLSTLRDFQVHTLKLDRSFVNTDDFSWKDEIILRNIIHMAGELGMSVLCEGVERDDQMALINSVGCYVIQGYYFDRPLPEEEFKERLKSKIYY